MPSGKQFYSPSESMAFQNIRHDAKTTFFCKLRKVVVNNANRFPTGAEMHSTIAADVVNGNDFVSARHFREYGVKDLNWRLNGYAAKNIDG